MHQLKRSSDLHEILSFHLRKIVSLALYFWRKDENVHVQRLKKEKDTLKNIKNHNKHEFFIWCCDLEDELVIFECQRQERLGQTIAKGVEKSSEILII